MKTCTVRNVLLFKVYPIQCHFHGWHIFIKCAYDASMRRLIFILNIGWGELRNIFWNFTIYVNFRNWNFQLGKWDCRPPDPPVKIGTCMYPQWRTFSCALGRRIYFADDALSCFFKIIFYVMRNVFFPIFRLNMFTVSCSALWILPLNAF